MKVLILTLCLFGLNHAFAKPDDISEWSDGDYPQIDSGQGDHHCNTDSFRAELPLPSAGNLEKLTGVMSKVGSFSRRLTVRERDFNKEGQSASEFAVNWSWNMIPYIKYIEYHKSLAEKGKLTKKEILRYKLNPIHSNYRKAYKTSASSVKDFPKRNYGLYLNIEKKVSKDPKLKPYLNYLESIIDPKTKKSLKDSEITLLTRKALKVYGEGYWLAPVHEMEAKTISVSKEFSRLRDGKVRKKDLKKVKKWIKENGEDSNPLVTYEYAKALLNVNKEASKDNPGVKEVKLSKDRKEGMRLLKLSANKNPHAACDMAIMSRDSDEVYLNSIICLGHNYQAELKMNKNTHDKVFKKLKKSVESKGPEAVKRHELINYYIMY